jgi:antibiotic biosynthesis monooxygenase (ABM) superfamily enzyme
MEDDLDFSRPENDGRNQCPSISPWTYDDESDVRCQVEKNHPGDHAGDGWYWTDEQERKPKKRNKWDIAFWIAASLNLVLLAFSVTQLFVNPDSEPPVWYLVSTWVIFLILLITLIGDVYTKHKKVKVK